MYTKEIKRHKNVLENKWGFQGFNLVVFYKVKIGIFIFFYLIRQ